MKEELGRILDDYGIGFTQSDHEEILRYFDVGDIINGNIKRASHDGGDDDRGYVDRSNEEGMMKTIAVRAKLMICFRSICRNTSGASQ